MQLHVDHQTAELINKVNDDEGVADHIVQSTRGIKSATIVRQNGRIRLEVSLKETWEWPHIRRDYANALTHLAKKVSAYMTVVIPFQ